ncbi:MAG: ABC transporter permease, partial [Oscillospiraceae bacterium]|nr:ABC transporter permease [Oscillospiraceae bacterium]
MKKLNRRAAAAVTSAVLLALILAIYLGGALIPDTALRADFSQKRLPPSASHLFGTDFLGRDMFAHTVKGLSLSLAVGAAASAMAAVVALAVGVTAAMGRGATDHAVNGVIDVLMSVPHTV